MVDPTEARHAAVAREMAREGRLLVPSLYGEPYYDKPSPYYLLLRAARHLPLGTEAALRIPSVVATLATAALLFGFARRRTGALAASVGTAIFLACPLVVVLGRFADQDAPLSALLTAAVVGLLSALDDPSRRLGLVAVAMGLGSWVKGTVAIVLPSVVAAVVAASRRTLPDPAVLRRAAGALAVACAIFAAWVVPAWFADPDYVSSFLLRHNVGRFAEASTGHAKPAWFYVPTMLGAMLPWSLLLPAAIAAGSRRGEAVREGERELLAWAAAIVVFYSLSRAKSAGYVLPAVGPLALWLGSRLVAIAGADAARTVEAPDETEDPHGAVRTADPSRDPAATRLPDPLVDDTPAARRVEFLLRAALGALAAIAVVAPVAAWIALRREAAPLAASGLLLLLPLALVGLLAARAAWREPRPLRATAAWTGLFAACLFATAYLGVAPLAAPLSSDRHLARFAAERAPGLPLVGFRLHPASLAFYSPGPVRKETDVEEVKRLAAAGPIVVLAREKDERALEEAGLRLHRWTEPGRHCLFGTTPEPPVAARGVDSVSTSGPRKARVAGCAADADRARC
ncbi:MAG: ArnT family glycosyltransferase [Alphaproteobacteria bacterium]